MEAVHSEWRGGTSENTCSFCGEIGKSRKPEIHKNIVKQKVLHTPQQKKTRHPTILKLEPHDTREPGTRESRALPGPQKFANAQNRKIGEVAKVENPSFLHHSPIHIFCVFDNFWLRTWRRCQKWIGNHTKKKVWNSNPPKVPSDGGSGHQIPEN